MPENQLAAIYRILDASANRAGEGMRTMEEFARFVLDDAAASEQWKILRHDLTTAIGRFPREQLLRARDTETDVGTQIQHTSEYQRDRLETVIAAAASRTQQSLRTLEEYGKTIDPKSAADFESIRYRCYTLAARLELNVGVQQRFHRLTQSSLYALVDCGPDQESFANHIVQLADAGVNLFQLRDRGVDDLTLLQRARVGREAAQRRGALFIINDRPDIAMAADADGVHVGQEELPVPQTRQIVGPERIVGVSTHSIQQARQAVADGADYIGCGPTFPGRTKNFESYPGTKFLTQIAAEIQIPAFAIGGIDMTNVGQVIETGVRRIAVTGALRDAEDPAATATRLQQTLAAK